jgi:dihydroxy-acid dehydratase
LVLSEAEIAQRQAELKAAGGYKFPANQTPWQEIQRGMVEQLGDGGVLAPAVNYQRIAQTSGLPRDNH